MRRREHPPVFVAVYARRSRDPDLQRVSVGVQEKQGRAYAAQHWPNLSVETFVDNDITAADPAVTRPGYQVLLQSIRAGRVAHLVAREQSRLTRQPVEWEELCTTLQLAGITEVHTTTSGTISVAQGSRLSGRIMAVVDASWSIAQTNIDGAVVGPASVADGVIALFDGTTGKLLKAGVDPSTLAPKASPTLTGTPAAPTAAQGTNTTQLATTAFVQTEAGLLVPKSVLTMDGDLLTRSGGVVARMTRAQLAADAAFTGTFVQSVDVRAIVQVTQAEYGALTPAADTLYVIVG